MQKFFFPCLLTALLGSVPLAHAGSFTVNNGSTTTSSQSLGSGQTGTVNSGGTLKVSGGSDAIDVTGNATITNSGSIQQTGSGRGIRDNTGNLSLVLTNNLGATIQAADADVIQMNKSGSTVTVNNFGTMTSSNASAGGSQVIDFNALTGTQNTVNNYAGALMQASEADAVRPGVNGVVNNDGQILSTTSTGSSSDGVDAQANSGITVNNAMGITANSATGTTAEAAGGVGTIEGARHGITGGAVDNTVTFNMTINNGTGGVIQGDNGSGINIDGFNAKELVTVTNHGTITGNGVTGDGDGVDVDGLVHLDNFGTIKSLNAHNDTSEGVTVGGGTIKNEKGALIEGDNDSTGAGVGITLAGVDKDVNDNPIPAQGIYAATSVDNFGTIRGQSGAGIQATSTASTFGITVTNEAGATIEGAGSTAAIQFDGTQSGVANKVVNSGTITADTSGQAIELGAGTNEVDIEGGAATVNGSISGGIGSTGSVMNVDAGSGNGFTYSGGISNFANVNVKSGTFHYTGTITGGTTTLQSGGTLSGTNTVGGLVIAQGGTLFASSDKPGRTTATSAVLFGGGTFLLQVDTDGSTGSAGTNWGQLANGGALNITDLSSSNQFAFTLQSLTSGDVAGSLGTFDASENHVWTDVITSSGITGTFDSADFSINSSAFTNPIDGTFSIRQDGANANDLDLVYTVATAAPEPSTWALLLGSAGLLVALRRRVTLACR